MTTTGYRCRAPPFTRRVQHLRSFRAGRTESMRPACFLALEARTAVAESSPIAQVLAIMRSAMIEIAPTVAIPEQELLFTATRSGGPGGQNVNKVATRITLFFDVAGSPSLTEVQRERITTRLATRINGEGVLRVVAQVHRTQSANRREALARFVELLRGALAQESPRVATRPSRVARERRVVEKKRRAILKQARRRPAVEE